MYRIWRGSRTSSNASVSRRLLPCLALAAVLLATAPTGASAATLTTGKADYGPGEVVDIYGTGFLPGATYSMAVQRPDGSVVLIDPATHAVIPGQGWDYATANLSGSFEHFYQLNGIIGPYEARAYPQNWNGDWNQAPVAAVTFTDGPGGSANIDQCENGPLLTPVPCTGTAWGNGNAHLLEGPLPRGRLDALPHADGRSGPLDHPYRVLLVGHDEGRQARLRLHHELRRERGDGQPVLRRRHAAASACSTPRLSRSIRG